MPDRIYPKRKRPVFLAEWRLHKGLTQQQLADRLGTSDVTISRWETKKRRPNDDAREALAEAMGIEPEDLFRHPDTPSADALLRGQPPEVVELVIKQIMAIRR